jgi:hypothetical protein
VKRSVFVWGYGFVLLLTTNKLLLIALQSAVALLAAWYFLRVVDQSGLVMNVHGCGCASS